MPHIKSSYTLLFNCLLMSLYIGLNSFTADTTKTNTFKFKTVVIDAGHGGKDPGTHGLHSLEKNVALSIAKKLKIAFNEQFPAINVVMTRKDDTFIELSRRSEIANENHGNLFISIHCNSSPEGTASRANKQKGVMILVHALKRSKEQLEAVRENSSIFIEKDYQRKYAGYDENDPVNRILENLYMQKYRKQSILFGDLLNAEFKETDKRPSIGVVEQSVLVLAHAGMPAVLVETGFINNPVDEAYLTSDDGQNEIVQAIIDAVKKYKKQNSFN